MSCFVLVTFAADYFREDQFSQNPLPQKWGVILLLVSPGGQNITWYHFRLRELTRTTKVSKLK